MKNKDLSKFLALQKKENIWFTYDQWCKTLSVMHSLKRNTPKQNVDIIKEAAGKKPFGQAKVAVRDNPTNEAQKQKRTRRNIILNPSYYRSVMGPNNRRNKY